MFALFAGEVYYPQGGWEDLVGVFGSLQEALDRCEQGPLDEDGEEGEFGFDWAHVVDLSSREVVWSRG